jgi:putative ABC transport system permease protein
MAVAQKLQLKTVRKQSLPKRPKLLFSELTRLYESIIIAFDSIISNKMRSGLTVLGIVVGVAVVVVVTALLEGAQNFIVNATANFAPDVLRVEKASFQDFSGDGQAFVEAQSKRPDIWPEDLNYLERQLGSSLEIGGQTDASLPAKRGAKTIVGIVIQGVTPNITELSNVKIEIGRGFTTSDNTYRRNVAIIGQDIVDELFGSENPLGQEIRLGQLPYEVIGVAEPRGSLFGNSQDAFVQIPLGTFFRVFGTRSRSIAILAKARDKKQFSVEDVEEQVRVVLRLQRGLWLTDKEDNFSIVTAKSVQAFSGTLTGIVGVIVYPLTAIALFVGGVVVMNMMLASVTERTREIGVRIAIGATRRDILTQFLIEAVILTVLGGLIGLIIAIGIIWLIAAATAFPLVLPYWAVGLAIGISCLVGIVFGVIPARRASKLDPIEALRAE